MGYLDGVVSYFLFDELPGDSHFVGDKILYWRLGVAFDLAFPYGSAYDTILVVCHGGLYLIAFLFFLSLDTLLLLGDFFPLLFDLSLPWAGLFLADGVFISSSFSYVFWFIVRIIWLILI